MYKRLIPIFVLLLLASTAAYSVVNAARSALPERAEQASCSARIALFCSAYGAGVCNAITPQDCGVMQTSEPRGESQHTHSIFYVLAAILFGVVFVELLRRRMMPVLWRNNPAHTLFSGNAVSPPIMVGGLSSLRF